MGDIAVDLFLETLKQLVTSSNLDFSIEEKNQLQSLEEEIKYLRRFLKLTEKKRYENYENFKLKFLVKDIKDLVLEAENIVEMFVVHASKADASNSVRGHQDHLSLDLDRVNKAIKNLKADVNQIYDKNMYDINGEADKRLKYSSTGSGGSGSSGGSNTSVVLEKMEVVGFKEEVEAVMKKLNGSGEGGPLEIISIVGPGGGGKTTLAREVYDDRLTLHTFAVRAWVHVSQDYDKDKTMKRDLLIRVLELISPVKMKYEASEDNVGEEILRCLKGRKYLIVMDDIWSIQAWTDIQRSFPRECKGSKVLFTSRLLVQPDINCIPHHLAPLSKTCSWELLQKKVFGNKCCPSKLVAIGEQIAEKCGGLPLGIVTTAGILATEDKTLDVWVEIAKDLSSIIAEKQERCMKILELSYYHLPFHLKACFLYVGAHLEGYEIHVRELIWLWIAEGFIQISEGGKSLEALAEGYLTNLIDRNLIMANRKSKSHGGIKACRLHDLLRELCLKKAMEDNFVVQISGDDSFSRDDFFSRPTTKIKHRRLFIGHKFFPKFSSRPHAQTLRSCLCFSLPSSSHSSVKQNLSFFVDNFKLLRVLSFIAAVIPGEIGKGDLIQLRYLALAYPAPNFFHYLSNLETLKLEVSYWERISLPRDIVTMVKLRHLYTKTGILEYHHVSSDEDEGNMMDSLQTLHRICICEHCLCFLKRTPNLRKLGLVDLDYQGHGVLMLPDLEFLKCLEILNVYGSYKRERIASTGLKLPPTLTRLTLVQTNLKWEELSIILQTVQKSLEFLKLLGDACSGPVWNTSELEEGFSLESLKYLKFVGLDIEEWIASEDQFPKLEVLVIGWCNNLKEIPSEFASLYDLREIKVECSSRSAEESAKEILEKQIDEKGEDDCLNLICRYNGS